MTDQERAQRRGMLMDKNKLHDMIEEIQKKRPDWRFSLLGGDRPREYKLSKDGRITGYKRTRKPFGWQAEFFGLKDNERLQSGVYLSADEAILIAVTMAKKAIKEGRL